MAVNDPVYVDGSLCLISSAGAAPTVYFADGGLYIVHEFSAAEGEVICFTTSIFRYLQRMRGNR